MATGSSTAMDITWLVNDLVDRVAHVDQAVVLSHDGLLIAKSGGLDRDDAEHLSAVAAGLHGLARGAARRFGRGGIRQTIIELESGFLFVTAGGNGACLAVLGSDDADVGLIAYEMEMLVARVGQYLSTPVRAAAARDASAGAPLGAEG
jgi:predicted regulator of Ras-like GTPase activity (Roadblock/LC7/MglB family)